MLSELGQVFARALEERNASFLDKQWDTLRAVLVKVSAVFHIPTKAGNRLIPACFWWHTDPAHDAARIILGRDVTDVWLDAMAAMMRLCAGTALHLAYRTSTVTFKTLLPMINQCPAGGSLSMQNPLNLLRERFFSHGLDLDSAAYIPPFNPAGRAWHNDAAAWRAHDGRATEEAATKVRMLSWGDAHAIQVAGERGLTVDQLAAKVRLSPWEWWPYSEGRSDDEGISIICDISKH